MIIDNLEAMRESRVNGIPQTKVNWSVPDRMQRRVSYYHDWQCAKSNAKEMMQRFSEESGLPVSYLWHLYQMECKEKLTVCADERMAWYMQAIGQARNTVQRERKAFIDMRTNNQWGVHPSTYRSMLGVIPELRIRFMSRGLAVRLFNDATEYFKHDEMAALLQNVVVKAGKVPRRGLFVPCSRSAVKDNTFDIDVADFGKMPSAEMRRYSSTQDKHRIRVHPNWAVRVSGKMTPIAYDSKCRPVFLLDAAYSREPLRRGAWTTGTWTAWVRGQMKDSIDYATTGYLHLSEHGILGVGESESEARKATHEMLALVGRYS